MGLESPDRKRRPLVKIDLSFEDTVKRILKAKPVHKKKAKKR